MEIKCMKVFLLIQICGLLLGFVSSTMSGFVVGGVEVPIQMYPYVARLTVSGLQYCGASIISDRVLVSAAHCINYPAFVYKVVVGAETIKEGQVYDVCRTIIHPQFNKTAKMDYYYDISLILLFKKLTFSPTVQKIQIASTFKWMKEKYRMSVAGFGFVNSMPSKKSTRLKATKMNYVTRDTCNRSQTSDNNGIMYVPDHMFCMIGKTWTSDCQGDSGSGVIWKGYLVGVVSSGRQFTCGSAMVPSMYTNVVYFKEWVNRNMKMLENMPLSKCETERKMLNNTRF